ncbi:MAG: hypothetical protein P8Q45_01885, partial [Candidatus Thalassarchaeaceae archaeon]|nr:hypothetical protein [Candidatus Thalassarchaeaceae archaeon]
MYDEPDGDEIPPPFASGDGSVKPEPESKSQDAFIWMIGVVSGLFALLSFLVLLLWFWAGASDFVIGGPPPTLTGWEESYRDLTGFDEVSGLDGSGVLVCVVDSGIEMDHPDL